MSVVGALDPGIWSGIPVKIVPWLPVDRVIPFEGEIHAGSWAAVKKLLAEANEWMFVRTSPPCLIHRTTGRIVEATPDLGR